MRSIRLILLLALLICCERDIIPVDTDGNQPDSQYGVIEFDFVLPTVGVPETNIRRVNLALAKTLDSLERKDFYSAANVSDFKQKYSFRLLAGTYYYQAGVTCTCGGDSCLYGGFPGGQWSIWWTSGFVEVSKGITITKTINFK